MKEKGVGMAARPAGTMVIDNLSEATVFGALVGGMIATEDAADRLSEYLYDDAGRLAATIIPEGQLTAYAYDAAGVLIEARTYAHAPQRVGEPIAPALPVGVADTLILETQRNLVGIRLRGALQDIRQAPNRGHNPSARTMMFFWISEVPP